MVAVVKFFSRILDLWARLTRPSQRTKTIPQVVQHHNLAQRQNSRVSYSHIGAVGELPNVYLHDDEMIVGNISCGGLLIVDDIGRLGTQVGAVIFLDLRWPDYTARMKCRIVGANLQRRHIQFIEFNQTVADRINHIVEAGLPGAKFYLVQNPTEGSSVEAEEIWLDSAGNNLTFARSTQNGELAHLHFDHLKIEFYAQKWPFHTENQRLLTPEELSEILLLFANFKNPSPRVRYLIEKLNYFYLRPKVKKTGS